MVLKRLADAERDGDRVYAVHQGNRLVERRQGERGVRPVRRRAGAVPEERVRAGRRVARDDRADRSPRDRAPRSATRSRRRLSPRSFGKHRPNGTWCALGSVKSMVGHTKAAAGAAGLIKAALALYNKVLPPTLKVKKPVEPLQPGKSPLYVNTERRPWLSRPEHPRRAGLSAFGFGGSNFHAVLEEHRPEKAAPDWDGRVQIVALSADSPAEACRSTRQRGRHERLWAELCNRAAESRAAFDRRRRAACSSSCSATPTSAK